MFISSSVSADDTAGLSVAAVREVVAAAAAAAAAAVVLVLAIGHVAACLLL